MLNTEAPDNDFSEWRRALLPAQRITPACLPDFDLGLGSLNVERTARLHFEQCLGCMGRYALFVRLEPFSFSLRPREAIPAPVDSQDLLGSPLAAPPTVSSPLDLLPPDFFAELSAAEPPTEWAVVLSGCRKDDPEAWQAFLRLFNSLARGVVWRYWLSALEREEIQDRVRVNLVQAILAGRFDEMEDPVRYITAAVRNAARDALRQRWPQRDVTSATSDDLQTVAASPLEHARVRQQAQCVESLVRGWGTVDRFIFVAKLEGVATATIQQRLQLLFDQASSAGAIDVRFNRLRKRVRRHCA